MKERAPKASHIGLKGPKGIPKHQNAATNIPKWFQNGFQNRLEMLPKTDPGRVSRTAAEMLTNLIEKATVLGAMLDLILLQIQLQKSMQKSIKCLVGFLIGSWSVFVILVWFWGPWAFQNECLALAGCYFFKNHICLAKCDFGLSLLCFGVVLGGILATKMLPRCVEN